MEYVSHTSWIQNGTIEENILFGLPIDYDNNIMEFGCVHLQKDLEMMEFGDQTEIGEWGITLSSGKKQKIQLELVVYQDMHIYLLDGIFSVVDAYTGFEIYKLRTTKSSCNIVYLLRKLIYNIEEFIGNIGDSFFLIIHLPRMHIRCSKWFFFFTGYSSTRLHARGRPNFGKIQCYVLLSCK